MQASKRLTLALAVALLSTGAEAGQPWVFLQQPGADQIVPTGINGRNGIVGNAMTISPSTSSAFLRTPDGTMTAIAPPGATQSAATAINADGIVTGYYQSGGSQAFGFIRDAGGTIQTFGIAGAIFTEPMALNDKGVIAGNYSDGMHLQSFLRKADGTFVTFAAPSAAFTSVAAI